MNFKKITSISISALLFYFILKSISFASEIDIVWEFNVRFLMCTTENICIFRRGANLVIVKWDNEKLNCDSENYFKCLKKKSKIVAQEAPCSPQHGDANSFAYSDDGDQVFCYQRFIPNPNDQTSGVVENHGYIWKRFPLMPP